MNPKKNILHFYIKNKLQVLLQFWQLTAPFTKSKFMMFWGMLGAIESPSRVPTSAIESRGSPNSKMCITNSVRPMRPKWWSLHTSAQSLCRVVERSYCANHIITEVFGLFVSFCLSLRVVCDRWSFHQCSYSSGMFCIFM